MVPFNVANMSVGNVFFKGNLQLQHFKNNHKSKLV